MENGIVIDITDTGVVQAMHMDEFPLTFLGKASIERATEIVFDEVTQLWDIVLPKSTKRTASLSGFTGYDEARKFEVKWIQTCRRGGVEPNTDRGLARAYVIRYCI